MITPASPSARSICRFPVIIDRTVAAMSDFTLAQHIDAKHYFGINWDRDGDACCCRHP
ncbi:hypothetical protein KCP74_25430 [Salmonella enterica subsp. enterica]|nr:hypothetical protein KCP74_25430 [Salmonella enterica subsp. enterica]